MVSHLSFSDETFFGYSKSSSKWGYLCYCFFKKIYSDKENSSKCLHYSSFNSYTDINMKN